MKENTLMYHQVAPALLILLTIEGRRKAIAANKDVMEAFNKNLLSGPAFDSYS